jgi:hypothetical protein
VRGSGSGDEGAKNRSIEMWTTAIRGGEEKRQARGRKERGHVTRRARLPGSELRERQVIGHPRYSFPNLTGHHSLHHFAKFA